MSGRVGGWMSVFLVFIATVGCGTIVGVAFHLVSPANGSTVTESQPRFVWTAAPNATGYVLVIRDAGGNVHWQFPTASGVTAATYGGPGLANGATYRWQVTANFAGPTPPQSSPEWTFTKVAGGGMEPTLVSPPNGASIVTGTPMFNWQPPVGGAPVEYKVEVRNLAGTLIWYISTPGTATSATYAGPALLNGTTYRWLVIAVHAPPNPPASSAEWTFTKVLIDAPTLVSPPNGGDVTCAASFAFSWTAVAGTERYLLEVRRASDDAVVWSTAVLPPDTSITAINPPIVCNMTYRWRVASIARGDATESWSAFWTFRRLP